MSECEFCNAFIFKGTARCWNCGETLEENDEWYDLLGGECVEENFKNAKYMELKGQVWKTPFGIGIKIFIPKEKIDHVMTEKIRQWNA